MSEKSEIHLKGYECKICYKYYSSQSSLCNHNKKYHNYTGVICGDNMVPRCGTRGENVVINTNTDKSAKYNCKFCSKNFNDRSNKHKHEKTCKNKETLLEENKKLKEEIIILENEKKTNQLVSVNNSTNKNQTNNGIINKNNGTINNNNTQNNILNKNIYINQIGNERINLTPKQIKTIVGDGLNGAMTCVRNVNFNKKKPENHNFYSSSLEGQFCTAINEKTQQPETIPKKEIVDRVLESSFKILEGIAIQIECNEDFREQFTEEEIKQLHNIIDGKKRFYERKNKKIFHNSVIGMSYTYKKLILSTWKLLQPPKEIQLGGELPDPTEVYYFPGDTSSDEEDEVDNKKVENDNEYSDDDFSYKIL
jgi:hypothetical protein